MNLEKEEFGERGSKIVMREGKGNISGKISECAWLYVCGMSIPAGRLKLPKAGNYDSIIE